MIVPTYKDEFKGTWYTSFYYTNYNGERKKKMKRGFDTKKAAVEFEREFLSKQDVDLNMTFEDFVRNYYYADMKSRVRESTWMSKTYVIEKKIIPNFRNHKLNEITAASVIRWQNKLLEYRNEKGEPYSQTYLKTINNQFNCIFNYANRLYDLKNPVKRVGSMGKSFAKEMDFWTKSEYLKFSESVMDKKISFLLFEVLYWTGMRIGEALALTQNDFDFKNNTVRISKSYQRLNGKDVITNPKTPESVRTITLSNFLVEEIKDYINSNYKMQVNDRLFPVTKSYIQSEMNRGCKLANVKRIRPHDLRHSAVSLLVENGFSALAISRRMGHTGISVTLRYAHLFQSRQIEMANKLDEERMNYESEES